jgi:hypothetical protein
MEKRLDSFKQEMARHKVSRSESVWAAAKKDRGSLSKYAVEVLKNRQSQPKKVPPCQPEKVV